MIALQIGQKVNNNIVKKYIYLTSTTKEYTPNMSIMKPKPIQSIHVFHFNTYKIGFGSIGLLGIDNKD